jgi:hypothetical protein
MVPRTTVLARASDNLLDSNLVPPLVEEQAQLLKHVYVWGRRKILVIDLDQT